MTEQEYLMVTSNDGGTGLVNDELVAYPPDSDTTIVADAYPTPPPDVGSNGNGKNQPSEKWEKFQRVATILSLAAAMVTVIYFITKMAGGK